MFILLLTLRVGKNTYQKLPENVRKIIEAGAKETQTWGYQEAEKRESELEKKLVESGMTLNNANIQAFIEASQPIYDEFISEVPNGKELLEKMKDTLK